MKIHLGEKFIEPCSSIHPWIDRNQFYLCPSEFEEMIATLVEAMLSP